MNVGDLEQGRDYYVNTNHTNLPTWAWNTPVVCLMQPPPTGPGYVEVWPVGHPPAERRQLHTSHLRTTPVPAGQPRSRTLTGPVHHIAPDRGQELTIFDALEEA